MEPFRGARRRHGAFALIIGLAVLLVGGCAAPAASAAKLAIADAWARPAVAGGTSAVYLTIDNPGPDDALVAVRCVIAGSAMIHQTTTDASGMTGMSPMERLLVPAGTSVALKPGGAHVMMTGLTRPLVAGERIELRLVFEHAGTITVAAAVRAG